MTCACPSCARRGAMTPDERAAFDASDLASEALELEFVGALLEPPEYVIPLAASTLRSRAAKRRQRARGRDLRAKQTRQEQQITSARKRLVARGYHVEEA